MRKHYRILLSDAAYKLVQEKSKECKEPIHHVLESMIMEFTRSNGEERYATKKLAEQIRDEYLMENTTATNKQIWRHGLLTGWKLFQLRKTTSMFKKYKKSLHDWRK